MKDWRKMLEGIGGYDNEMIGVPSGGVKEMVEDIESLQQQLANATKQNVLLRDAVDSWLQTHSNESHDALYEAFISTADLSGYILCDAEHFGHFNIHNGDSYIQIKPEYADGETIQLYNAREKP